MPRRALLLLGAALGASTGACSAAIAPPPGASVLPLRSVRLYETGVGYFERSGTVSAPTSLPVPAGHLDDALQTLVVLGADRSARVRGVEFGSSIGRGMARALAGLPADGDEPLGMQQILVGLKGATVDARLPDRELRGRVVDVVMATPDGVVVRGAASGAAEAQPGGDAKDPRTAPSLTMLLLTGAGAVERVRVAELASVRPVDGAYASRLGAALDALSTQSARRERMLGVLTGGGPIALGYVAETPVWRTTYRVVLDRDGQGATLQGWALLHNDTDEDWRGVRVELANGRPDSFLFPMAAPRYARRQLVTPDDQLASVPQLLGTTVDALYGDQAQDASGAAGLGLSGYGEGGGGSGSGVGLGRLGTIGHGSGAPTGSNLLSVGNLAAVAQAEGAESGALFVYTLADRVDLPAHDSALVPFAEHHVDARVSSWMDGPGATARSAVRFVNSTSQTLPAGTVAFFAEGAFAGQSALPRLKPGERRVVTYGVDLDVELRQEALHAGEEPRRLVWDEARRRLEEHYLKTTDATYEIENRSGQRRAVLLATTLDRNATVSGVDAVDFDEGSARPVEVFVVDPAGKTDRSVHVVEGLERETAFDALTAERLSQLASSPSLPAADRAGASAAAARLKEAEADGVAMTEAKADVARLEKDLDRLREHMKALAGDHPAGAGANPFAARVLAGEDRLTALRARLAKLEAHQRGQRDLGAEALAKLVR